MLSSWRRQSALAAPAFAFATAVLLSGCTTGRAWVHDVASAPVSAPTEPDDEAVLTRRIPSPDEVQLPPTGPEPARRRVITLGEWHDTGESAVRPPGVTTAAASTTTTNFYGGIHMYRSYGPYGYGGYGWYPSGGYGRPSVPPGRPAPAPSRPDGTPPRIGGDWPKVPDHGPPAMTQTLPANPWR